MPDQSPGFLEHNGRALPLAEIGFEIETNSGEYEDIAGGRPFHALSLWADPADEQIPRLVITDADLYLDDFPDGLDGLRLRVDTDSGDFINPPAAWIRPGSLTGMAQVIFEPASKEDSGDWDPDARKNLRGPLELCIDKHGDEYRIRIAVCFEGEYDPNDPKPNLVAEFTAPLEVLDWGHP